MKSLFAWLLALPAYCCCGPAEELVAGLIQEQWQTPDVRIQWEFLSPPPSQFDVSREWGICGAPKSNLAGSIVVCLEARGGNTPPERVCLSGIARVFRPALTPRSAISMGREVTLESLDTCTAECTHLQSPVASEEIFRVPQRAARTLVPGRPVCRSDLCSAPLIRRGQMVEVVCRRGVVQVRTMARALADGSPGEVIPVVVTAGADKRLKGRVSVAGRVELEL